MIGYAISSVLLSCTPAPVKKWRSRWPAISSILSAVGLFVSATQAQFLSDETLANISFEQKPGSQVSLDLSFVDESGRQVRLGDLLRKKPVILFLGYYQCPMLCTLALNGMVEALQDIRWSIGKEFDVISVSIDPTETPALAGAKKRIYLKRYGRAEAASGWHFLTGTQTAIQQLTQQVGFHYAYDRASRQYAHPGGLVILTPQGKVAAYLFGVTYSPRDLLAALKGASANEISGPIRNLILLCFHYNPIKGKYGAAVMAGVRILSAITVLLLAWLIFAGVRGRRRGELLPAKLIDNLVSEGTCCTPDGHSPSNDCKSTASFGRGLEGERVL